MDVLNPLNFNATRGLSLFDFKRPFVFNPYWEEVWRVKGKPRWLGRNPRDATDIDTWRRKPGSSFG